MILQAGPIIKFLDGDFKSLENLPPKVFLLDSNPQTGELFLREQNMFTLPEKIYGNLDTLVDRYLNTFKDRKGNLGILLKGLKGTGKSLLAKKLCIESNLPIIKITSAYSGTGFETFLDAIKQECIIFIDEFEKVYYSENNRGQDGLLTILDGGYESKKIFLLTCNDELNINDALMNRPGRVYYTKNYEGLSDDVIDSIIDDNLVDKSHKESLKRACFAIGQVNIDSLLTIISEMNRYKESPKETLEHINILPEDASYEIRFKVKTEVFQKPVCLLKKDGLLKKDVGKLPKIERELEYYHISNSNPLADNSMCFYGEFSNINNIIDWDEELYNHRLDYEVEEDLSNCDISFLDNKTLLIKSNETGIEYKVQKSIRYKSKLVF